VTVQVLLDNGVTVAADVDGWMALHLAVLKENEAAVQLLLNYGADAKAKDENGVTALDWAALHKDGTAIRKLEKRASSKAKKSFVIAGLCQAAYLKDVTRVRAMLANGDDINERGDGGFTALIWAAFQGDEAMVELLLENGATVDAKNDSGETAMDYAIFGGYDAIAQLLQNGTCVDVDVNEDERLAALQKQNRILQLLESQAKEGGIRPTRT
jgi:ankyrin repeat protein